MTEKHQIGPGQILEHRQIALINALSAVQHHTINLSRAKYRVVKRVSRALRWEETEKEREGSIVWLDRWENADLTNLRYYKVGHFPGMSDLGTKCQLGRSLNRLRQEFPQDYDFHPLSFTLPADRDKLAEYDAAHRSGLRARAARVRAEGRDTAAGSGTPSASTRSSPDYNPGGHPLLRRPVGGCWPAPGVQPQPLASAGDRMVYIVKPDSGSRGQGIYLALGLEGIDEFASAGNGDTNRPRSAATDGGGDDGDEEDQANKLVMVQAYLPRPLLIDNRKFDLRIYVLVTSVYPTVRLFVYSQGLVRFATVPYKAPDESNIAQRRMFLTNYAVNKPGERPRSPKTGIDDVPDGTARAVPRASRFDRNLGGGADADRDDNSDGSDNEDGDGDGGSGTRWGPPRDRGIELVRQRVGCKWTLSGLWACLEAQGIDTEVVWARIKDVITKTILAARPAMAAKYRAARPQLRKEATPAWVEAQSKPVKKRLTARPPSFLTRPSVSQHGSAAAGEAAVESPAEQVNLPSPGPSPVLELVNGPYGVADTVKAVLAGHNSNGHNSHNAQLQYPTAGAVAAVRSMGNGAGGGCGVAGNDGMSAFAGLLATGSSIPLNGVGISAGRPGAFGQRTLQQSTRLPSMPSQTHGAAGGMDFGLGLTISSAPLLQPGPKPLPIQKAAIMRQTAARTAPGTVPGLSVGVTRLTADALQGAPISHVPSGPARLAAGASSVSFAGMTVTGLTVKAVTSGPAMGAGSALPGPGLSSLSRPLTLPSPSSLDAISVASSVAHSATAQSLAASSVITASQVVGGYTGGVSAPVYHPGSLSADNSPVSTPAATPLRPGPKAKPLILGGGVNGAMGTGASSAITDEAALLALQEEDGEQGFKAYEFMGLDIILDMSHCACERSASHQRISSDESSWPALRARYGPDGSAGPRCQPRPVLLEINQSCSMHTDTDLDVVVKGDAVGDAFGLAAADEKWLLEAFVQSIKAAGGLAAVASGAGSVHGLESVTSGEEKPLSHPSSVGLINSVVAAEAALVDPSRDPLTTKVTATGTTVDCRACLNDLKRVHVQAVAAKRSGLELAGALLGEAWAKGFPTPPATSLTGKPAKENGGWVPAPIMSAGIGEADYDPAAYVSTSGDGGALTNDVSGAVRPDSASALASGNVNSRVKSDLIPWVPPPTGPGARDVPLDSSSPSPPPCAPPFSGLYSLSSLTSFWAEELWFGTRHHEAVLAAVAAKATRMAAASAAAAAASSSAVADDKGGMLVSAPVTGAPPSGLAMASVVDTMMKLRQAAGAGPGASGVGVGPGALDKEKASKAGHTYTLATVPPLSMRAQLVLLLRRIHESIHSGGFERMLPPTDPRLADRYRRIAEFVPPALRETPAYARRRLEALAVRAAIESKKGGSFRV